MIEFTGADSFDKIKRNVELILKADSCYNNSMEESNATYNNTEEESHE